MMRRLAGATPTLAAIGIGDDRWRDASSGLSTLLPDRFGESPVEGADRALPVIPILVGAAILVVIGVSWLSFRREGSDV